MSGESLVVSGGSAGITADIERMRAAARRLDAAATELGLMALSLHAYLADPDIVAAGACAPRELLCFEADLTDALDGWAGLTLTAAALAAIAGLVYSAAESYERAEELATLVHDQLAGAALLPPSLVLADLRILAGHDPALALQAVLSTDPEVADVVVNAIGLPAQLAALSRTLPDGSPVVTATGRDPGAERPPRSLADLIAGLARRNDEPAGAVDVRILTDAHGARRVIVDIPGTKSWATGPVRNVTSLTTNARALVGEHTTYEAGVLAAMRRAGVRPDDDVLLVGHSQGGMVAVNAARTARRSGRFRVTHVLTAGSPIGLTTGTVPSGVSVLALENRRDVVPHLDGRTNADRVNVTTVTGTAGDGSVVGDHDLRTSYLPLATATDASSHPSVRRFLAGADGFFTANRVETRTYLITRHP